MHLNEGKLEERLVALGETDMLHWTPFVAGCCLVRDQIELDRVCGVICRVTIRQSTVEVRHQGDTKRCGFKGQGRNRADE
jgi:hypothetical protein